MYLVFALFLSVSFLNVQAENICAKNDPAHCLCLPNDEVEFQCPPFNFKVVLRGLPEVFLDIDCYQMDTFDVNLFPNYVSGNTSRTKVRFCPLPEDNFIPLLDKFKIQTIQQFQLENVSIADTASNRTISKELFVGLSSVEILTLSRISDPLDDDLLAYFPKLTQFYLETSDQDDLNNFKFPTTLKVLHLTGNLLTEVPKGIVHNLTELRQLHLWHNNIKEIKRNDFIGLTELRSLELSLNDIQSIEENSFADLKELRTINLRANKLHKISPTIFKYNIHLASIRLEDNHNITLPDGLFANLKELNNVTIKNSDIDYVPENLFENSSSIANIYMQINHIKDIPEKLYKGLSKLKYLDLSYNFIYNLSSNIFADLNSLEVLILDYNKLVEISHNLFKSVTNLKTLSLKHNYIVNIPPTEFIWLKRLESIDLSYNAYEISDIGSPFGSMVSLKMINLRNNSITDVPDIFQYTYIQKVDLSYNRIRKVMVGEIMNTASGQLDIVNLSNNEIDEVNFETVETTAEINQKDLYRRKSRIVVDLKHNPLICDCGIYDLTRYLHGHMNRAVESKIYLQVDGIKCSKRDIYGPISIVNLMPEKILCKLPLKNCPAECESSWRPSNNYWELDCSNRNLTQFPTLNISNKNISLHLDGNYICGGLNSDMGYDNVKNLYLSNNKLNELKWVPEGIEILTLDNNELTHLDSELMEIMNKTKHLQAIKLSNNPWACGCSAFSLQTFIRDPNNKVNPKDVICAEDQKPLADKVELCKSSLTIILTIALPLVGFLVLTIAALLLYIRYRQEVKVWLYAKNMCLWFVTEEELDEDKKYDIFISYSNKDEDFVMQNLLPVLETGPNPVKTCIHIRDWEPGEMIMTHVTRSVENSRRTLVVLSNNFLESIWGIAEFKTAHTQAISEGRARVIVVKYGNLDENKLDEDLKAYLNTNTYVEWGKPWFWNKLKYALPHSQRGNGYYKSNQKHANVMLKIDDKFELTSPPLVHPESTPPVITLDPALLKNHPLNIYTMNGKMPTSETPLVV